MTTASDPAAVPEDDLGQVLTLLGSCVEQLSATVGAGAMDELDGAGLVAASRALRTAGHRLDAVRLHVVAQLGDNGGWALDGSRSLAHWLARAEGVALPTARRDVRTARLLRDLLPGTARDARAGLVGADHVRTMVDVAPTSDARRQALLAPVGGVPGAGAARDGADGAEGADGADGLDGSGRQETGEELLLAHARSASPEQFRRVVRRFAHVADPDADERGYSTAREKEFLEVSPTWDGYHVAGFLTVEHGQAVRAALDAVMGRPAADDRRTASQRRAQGMADLARVALDSGAVGSGAAVRPHLQVTVSLTELRAMARGGGSGGAGEGDGGVDPARVVGPAGESLPLFADHDTPIPASLLRRLACDSEVTRIVFGPDSQVLDVGRSRRTVTGQLRRAVIARDRHCTWPGCHEPPQRCEVHHAVTHWADGGRTSIDNAALLCWHHHDRVDAQGITMRWGAPTEGGFGADEPAGWLFHDRHGLPLGSPARASAA